MKYFKPLIVAVLLIFGLSGCYTQLQYSQKMKRVTDREKTDTYAWDGEEQARPNDSVYSKDEREAVREEIYYNEDYVPYYTDYETARYYEECYCDFSTYKQGYQDGVFDTYNDFYYASNFRYGFGSRYYYGPRYGNFFSFSIGFGSPYYHSFYHPSRWYLGYYDPFFYDPFYYGWRPYYYGHRPYYGNYYGYYGGKNYHSPRNTRTRSIGTSRVNDNTRTRSRSGDTRVNERARTRSDRSAVRSRSNGTSRSRGTVERSRSRSNGSGRVERSKSRSRSGSGSVERTRSRTGGNDRSSDGSRSRSRVDNDKEARSAIGLREIQRERIRERSVRNPYSVERRNENTLQNARERVRNQRKKSLNFWERVQRSFQSRDSRRAIRSGNNNIDTRSIRSRSNNRSNNSSVRSRSSSSSRSSGSVSRSKSRSSSSKGSRSGSSSRSRSRGGN